MRSSSALRPRRLILSGLMIFAGVDISPTNYAVVERIAHWQAALNMAETAPCLGVGLGKYDAIYAEHRLLNWDDSLGHAHNLYLNLLAEGGFLGVGGVYQFLCDGRGLHVAHSTASRCFRARHRHRLAWGVGISGSAQRLR